MKHLKSFNNKKLKNDPCRKGYYNAGIKKNLRDDKVIDCQPINSINKKQSIKNPLDPDSKKIFVPNRQQQVFNYLNPNRNKGDKTRNIF